jgi:hypothetical protein
MHHVFLETPSILTKKYEKGVSPRCVLLMNGCVLLMNWCVLLMKVVDGLRVCVADA